jgi:hypothetical protein
VGKAGFKSNPLFACEPLGFRAGHEPAEINRILVFCGGEKAGGSPLFVSVIGYSLSVIREADRSVRIFSQFLSVVS